MILASDASPIKSDSRFTGDHRTQPKSIFFYPLATNIVNRPLHALFLITTLKGPSTTRYT